MQNYKRDKMEKEILWSADSLKWPQWPELSQWSEGVSSWSSTLSVKAKDLGHPPDFPGLYGMLISQVEVLLAVSLLQCFEILIATDIWSIIVSHSESLTISWLVSVLNLVIFTFDGAYFS